MRALDLNELRMALFQTFWLTRVCGRVFAKGGAEASAGVRAQLRQALEDRDRDGGRRGCADHARKGCGVRPSQRRYVAGARPTRDVRERAEGPE